MTNQSPSEIFARAYTERPGARAVAAKPRLNGDDNPSPWTLIFDCETTVDPAQTLRVGVFQVRKSGKLKQEGLFFDPQYLCDDDIGEIENFAEVNNLEILTTEEFRKGIFLKIVYHRRGLLIGFNLPFDISRIAIDHGPARGSLRGGFTFKLNKYKSEPQVRVKHLSARASLMDFAAPGKQETPRGMRKKGMKTPHHRGYFLDVKTFAASLTSRSFSLGSLCKYLGTTTQKLDTDEHGGPITSKYLKYACADVQATWECYAKLQKQFDSHGLETASHRILSEASIGKAYLKQMNIQPFLANLPDFPREIFGKIMCAYYGGRAEVRIRRTPTQVLYCDFKSMYPTVSALMGLWPFVVAENLSITDTTSETQAFLNDVCLEDLKNRDTWKRLRTLVRIHTDYDLLPVRAKYNGKTNTIGLNHITNDQSLWYTLADCVTSKLLTGKTPIIGEAMTFEPGGVQSDLQPIDLFGNSDYRVDPSKEDVFTRFIDLRDEARKKGDPVQQAIKIVANSTSYGIFIEVNRDDAPKPEPLDVYGPDGHSLNTTTTAVEEPGRYFHPLLGTLITGAARLMLALSERVAADQGLNWVFCDTDSLAMAKPDGMSQEQFYAKGKTVVDWFEGLNPYKKPGSILEMEDANYIPNTKILEPLYCLAISSKRYALYNKAKSDQIILRKASAHGLGHLMAPYTEGDAPDIGVETILPTSDTCVLRWQHDLWINIIHAALGDTPNIVPLDYHPAFKNPCVSRYGATSPHLLKWVDKWNDGKPYEQQIKPFGFLMSFTARSGPLAKLKAPEIVDPSQRGRPPKPQKTKPIAPFDLDNMSAVSKAFDRDTGDAASRCELKTYEEALAQFHLSTEDKFLNGNFVDVGETKRRHIVVSDIGLIGKEANKVGASGEADPVAVAQKLYGRYDNIVDSTYKSS